MTNAGDQAARGQRAHGAALAMTVICAAQFVLQLDFSIVNVALPTIQRELHMAAAQLQWIVTGYALTFGSLLLAGGRLADLLGRRRLLAAGLVWFAVASLVAGLSEWPVMLIVARLVQGAAGAMVSPAALSLLTTTNPDGPARARALSIWQATTAAGATTGIVAGGVLTQYLGWRAVFLVNPPIIAIMLALFGRLPASRPAGRRQPCGRRGRGAGDRGDRGADLRAEQRAAERVRRAADHRRAGGRGGAGSRLRLDRADRVLAHAAAADPGGADSPGGRGRDADDRRGAGRLRVLRLALPAEGPGAEPGRDGACARARDRHRGDHLHPADPPPARPAGHQERAARRARLHGGRAALVLPALAGLQLLGRSAARAAVHRAGHRLRAAHGVDRDHQRCAGPGPGTGRGPVHHEPASRCRGRARDPGHGGRRPHRARRRHQRRRRADRRVPALVPHRHRHRAARRRAGRDSAPVPRLPGRTGPPEGGPSSTRRSRPP